MALFIHTTGILAKLFSEAVEAIDPRPVEAIRTTGASSHSTGDLWRDPTAPATLDFVFALSPQSNVRSATVLGIIGAGGIGLVL